MKSNSVEEAAGEGYRKIINDETDTAPPPPAPQPLPPPPPGHAQRRFPLLGVKKPSLEPSVQLLSSKQRNGGNHRTRRENRKNGFNVEEVNSSKNSILEKKFKSLDDALVLEECQPKIQRIPSIVNECAKYYDYYKPKMVSIGPYHHRCRPSLEATETVKLKLAAVLIQEHSLCKDELYSKIKSEISDLRECYQNDWRLERFDDDELTWMFLVDGCAVLYYIHCAMTQNYERVKSLKLRVDSLTFMQHDLFLLENQLPYRVLQLLMSCLNKENEMRESIEKFISDSIKAPGGKQQKLEHQQYQSEGPIHLLDLLRTRLLQSIREDQTSCFTVRQLTTKNVIEFIGNPLEIFQSMMEYMAKKLEHSSHLQTQDSQYFFRSVEELQAAGIRFRPSNPGRLTDITFNLGTLKLPPIIVDDLMASKFFNLIAHEMCPDFDNDFGVSSYIVFLKSLINRAQDVKELRDKQILYNALGGDEEVAELFNIIGNNLVSNQEKYSKVKSDIQKRYSNKWLTWIAQFIHRHFQSPWSALVFIAAIIILASTVAQTIYIVLSYHKHK